MIARHQHQMSRHDRAGRPVGACRVEALAADHAQDRPHSRAGLLDVHANGKLTLLFVDLQTSRGPQPLPAFPIQIARSPDAQRRRVGTELLPGTRLVAKFSRRCFDCGRTPGGDPPQQRKD